MLSRRPTIEICVGDVESAIAAEAGGADRVELCDNLDVGGTTPSAGMIAETCRWLSVPVHVLIRPRPGDFVYSDRELAVMQHDIEAAKALGTAGVVLGVLTGDGTIDGDRTAALARLARPLSVTFHKAIDFTTDPVEALETLQALGIDRVLTAGGRPTVMEGLETLRTLVGRAGDRIAVMAGGRLGLDDLDAIIRSSGVREIHLGSAVRRPAEAQAARTSAPSGHPAPETSWCRTDALRVAELVERLQRSFESP
jgi:copper homeostasis protein